MSTPLTLMDLAGAIALLIWGVHGSDRDHTCARPATPARRRSRNSEPKAARQSPADNPAAPIPTRSSSKPNRNGEAD